jgi:hypothetical protein
MMTSSAMMVFGFLTAFHAFRRFPLIKKKVMGVEA